MSKTEAIVLSMVEQGKDCINRKKQLENDYNRISNRYSKLFGDLDKELSTRIRALDKPIFNFCSSLNKHMIRKTNNDLLGISVVANAENTQLNAILANSTIKGKAQSLIESSNQFLKGITI
jgi:hypothetical protein